MEERFDQLEQKIRAIEERNARVEKDKIWEVSITRRIVVSCLVYLTAAAIFVAVGFDNPYLNAVIPGAAYFVSTLSLSFVKKFWSQH